jgi:hypothetical protein
MKIPGFFLTVTLSGLMLFTGELRAQDHMEQVVKTDQQLFDSVKTVKHQEELIIAQKAVDEDKMMDAKEAQRQTKEIAKETRRVDREASAAAREAKMAYKSERKAQKARRDADRQSRKAVRAKDISDKN